MNTNNINLLSTLIALVFISACSSQPSSSNTEDDTVLTTSVNPEPAQTLLLDDSSIELKHIRINHYKVECEGYWVDQCLQIQEQGDDQWLYFYEQIEGFDFVWGHEYELLVEVEQTPAIDELAHQSTTVYRLSQVLSDIHHANESFVYSSRHPSTILTKQDDGGYALLDGKKVSCGVDDCLSIESAIVQQQGLALSLKHDVNPAEPLVLEAILCSSSLVSFASDCGFASNEAIDNVSKNQ